MKKVLCIIFVLMFLFTFASCSEDESIEAEASGRKQVINFLNWGDYIDTETIEMFEAENPDIDVKLTTVPSNEEMYIVATTEGSAIDIIVPSEYMTQKMIREGYLAKLDTSAMENYKYVSDYAETYSYPGSAEYAVPYMWGTFGILYNKEMVDEPVDSWEILWNEKYEGKIFMYDSIRDTIGVALKYLGYSMNSTDPEELEDATELLIEQKPLVLAYGTDELRMSMVNESGALAIVYAGDAVYAMYDNENLEYVVPKEGSNIFVDNFCIMASTDAYDASLRFIDFMCDPYISARNSEYNGYSCPTTGYEEYIEETELLEIDAYAPDRKYLESLDLEYYSDIGDAMSLYEDAWIKIKAR